jgi:hypothetical protein
MNILESLEQIGKYNMRQSKSVRILRQAQLIAGFTMGLSLSLLTTGTAEASSFNFTKIADSSDFGSLSPNSKSFSFFTPSINDRGEVAFFVPQSTPSNIFRVPNPGLSPELAEIFNTPGFRELPISFKDIYIGDGVKTTPIFASSPDLFVASEPFIVPLVISLTPDLVFEPVGSPPIYASSPSINNHGTVAFTAFSSAQGKTPIQTGIFTSNGKTLTSIVDFSESFDVLGSPSINNQGAVAFSGTRESSDRGSGTGFFTGYEKGFTKISDAAPELFRESTIAPSALINDSGAVVFVAQQTEPIIVNRNTGELDSPSEVFAQIVTVDKGTTTIISDEQKYADAVNELRTEIVNQLAEGTLTEGTVDLPPQALKISFISFNNQGDVAFTGLDVKVNIDSENIFPSVGIGLHITNGTGYDTIAFANRFDVPESSDYFYNFLGAAINDQKMVAFVADLRKKPEPFYAESGIFTGSDILNDKVITTEDTLFGSKVQNLRLSSEGINNSGQIAFYAAFEDGTGGVFRADPTPVPEPGSALGLLAFGVLGCGSFLKRRKMLQQTNTNLNR